MPDITNHTGSVIILNKKNFPGRFDFEIKVIFYPAKSIEMITHVDSVRLPAKYQRRRPELTPCFKSVNEHLDGFVQARESEK